MLTLGPNNDMSDSIDMKRRAGATLTHAPPKDNAGGNKHLRRQSTIRRVQWQSIQTTETRTQYLQRWMYTPIAH